MKSRKSVFSRISAILFLVVMSSMNVFAAPRIFDGLTGSLDRILTYSLKIPHPGSYATETVGLIYFIAIWTCITALIYALVTWEKTHMEFIADKKRLAITFSVALSGIALYAVPLAEWITELIRFAAVASYILILLMFAVLAFLGYKLIRAKGGQASLALDKLHKANQTQRLNSFNEAKDIIEKSIKKLDKINPNPVKDKTNIVDVGEIITNIDSCIPKFEDKVINVVFGQKSPYGGPKLINLVEKKLGLLKNFTGNMPTDSKDYEFIKDARDVKAIKKSSYAMKKLKEIEDLITTEIGNVRASIGTLQKAVYNFYVNRSKSSFEDIIRINKQVLDLIRERSEQINREIDLFAKDKKIEPLLSSSKPGKKLKGGAYGVPYGVYGHLPYP